MSARLKRRSFLAAVVSLQAAVGAGCYGPDNPQINKEPTFTAPTVQTPPDVSHHKVRYGSDPKYRKMMEKMEQHK